MRPFALHPGIFSQRSGTRAGRSPAPVPRVMLGAHLLAPFDACEDRTWRHSDAGTIVSLCGHHRVWTPVAATPGRCLIVRAKGRDAGSQVPSIKTGRVV